ncbi:hypothetical protein HK096_003471, partial [Nowakowskiella sp. JEL0078]
MEKDEITLLENVELKFALADSDDKFERILLIFLAPVLLKLNSPSDVVRKKVTEICTHINRRLKSSPAVKIPVKAILDQFIIPTSTNLLRNFSLIYLDMGFMRLSDDEKVTLLPGLLSGISKRLPTQQISLFQIALPIIASGAEQRTSSSQPPTHDPYSFESNLADARFVLQKILHVLLYTTPPAPKAATPFSLANPEPETAEHNISGISKSEVQFITNSGKATWTKSNPALRQLKLGLVKFCLSQTQVPEKIFQLERFLVFIVASADNNHELISAGEDALKRTHKPDLESVEVISRLYNLYQGSSTQQPYRGAAEKYVYPASNSVKTRILTYLLKSAAATNQFPSMLQVSFDSLYGEESTTKLRNLGMAFVQWIARTADKAKITPIGPILLSGLIKFIDENKETGGQDMDSLRGFAYEAVGLLSKRVPEIFRSDVSILYKFFAAVSTEERNVRVSVQDALSNMIDAYSDVSSGYDSEKRENSQRDILKLLLENVEKSAHQARYVSVKYANALFPFSNIEARFISLLASFDQKLEVKEEARRGLHFPRYKYSSGISESESFEKYRKLLPNFGKSAHELLQKSRRSIIHIATGPGSGHPSGLRYVGGITTDVYANLLSFLRRLLVIDADPSARQAMDAPNDITGPASNSGGAEITLEEFSSIIDQKTRNLLRKSLLTMWEAEQKSEVAKDNEMIVNGEEKYLGIGHYIDIIEFALKSEAS